jgi:hypothetical protein
LEGTASVQTTTCLLEIVSVNTMPSTACQVYV